ncbi:hypothetical protein H5410_045623 [Solanum commersonii]|uniref:Uncharacterized protein n=1 Tax=Solanum commersonii TaxID=4109 RepID=A0A9J5XC53_SOLCO|nr:hypothetical protein H5410_045623 [Solanum commersonii]
MKGYHNGDAVRNTTKNQLLGYLAHDFTNQNLMSLFKININNSKEAKISLQGYIFMDFHFRYNSQSRK